MGNVRTARMIDIDGAGLWDEINGAGYSIRKLAKKIDYDRKTITLYLKKNIMPDAMLDKIDQVINPTDKTVMIRMSVRVPITDGYLLTLMRKSELEHEKKHDENGFDDVYLLSSDVMTFLNRNDLEAVDENYIPGVEFEQYKEWYDSRVKKNGKKVWNQD